MKERFLRNLGKPIDAVGFYYNYKKILKLYDCSAKIEIHYFRHSCVTLFVANIIDLTKCN